MLIKFLNSVVCSHLDTLSWYYKYSCREGILTGNKRPLDCDRYVLSILTKWIDQSAPISALVMLCDGSDDVTQTNPIAVPIEDVLPSNLTSEPH